MVDSKPATAAGVDRTRAAQRELLRLALEGDPAALHQLVVLLTPPIQVAVAGALRSRGAGRFSRSIRQDVEELCQEVFAALFDRDGRILRGWNPEAGLSLRRFVKMVAGRRTISLLRASRNRPWQQEDATAQDELDSLFATDTDVESAVVALQLWHRATQDLRATLDAKGQLVFDLLYVDQVPTAEITRRTGLATDAVYKRRSRYRAQLRARFDELANDDAARARE